jgi:methionine synthase I (cobalamin-dependent)
VALTLAERLRAGAVLLDGGMGSALMAGGLPPGAPPELWNLERADAVRAVHAACLSAGSMVVQTNTFGASRVVLARHGLAQQVEEINRRAVAIARSAAGPDRLVAGNIGPSGALLAPLGQASAEELTAAFAEQAQALASAGADYLAVETMMDLQEALCALRGARQATDLPVTVCLTYERRARGFFTLMGNRPADSARALADGGATAVGANCSIGSAEMVALVSELVAASPVPVIAKPNAGLPDLEGGVAVYRQTPEDFADDMAAMVRAGARAVGGCCGTDARFIAATAAAIAGGRAGTAP